jgi:hypothetical protein
VLFSKMLSKPKAADSAPEMIWRWTAWEDEAGGIHDIPPHAKVISRGTEVKERHYALVCDSNNPARACAQRRALRAHPVSYTFRESARRFAGDGATTRRAPYPRHRPL